MGKKNINGLRGFAAFMSLVFAFVSIVHGQNRTWTGSGGDSNWNTAGNWSGNTLPTGTAVFNASTYPSLSGATIALGSAQTIGGLQAVGTAGGSGVSSILTIGSGASPVLSFNNGASISLTGGLSLAFNANVAANGSLLIDNRSNNMGTISFLGALDAGGNAITFNTAFTDGTGIVVSGSLIAGDITKAGDGTIRFSSATAATVTGNINFNAGRIIIDGNNVLGSGVIRLGSGGNTRQLAITGTADYSLGNALDLTTNLNVFRLDEDSATSYRKLTLDPSSAFASNIGASGTLTVGKLVDLALGENQNFSGGTLAKTGGGILRLSGAGSTFVELVVTQGSVLADIRSDMTLGGGSSIFGAGKVTVDGGDTTLGITSNNASNIFTLGAGADIALTNGALFSLDNATLHLQSGTIDTGTTGRLQFDGKVMLGSTVMQGTSLVSNGIALGGDVVFTNNTGIVNTASHLFRLSNTGTQVLSHNGSGVTTIAGNVVKTGTGLTILDNSLTSLTFGNGAQLNAGVFDLGTGNLVANANGGVTIGSGTLSFGKVNQFTGDLTYAGGGVALMNGYSQIIGNVIIGAGQIGLIKLGGDAGTSSTLTLGELTFGNAGSILSIADYMAGANSDRIFYSGTLTQPQLNSNVWFYGYNPGVRLVSGELLTPVRSGTNTPDFLQVEWTNADNDLNAANYKNWRTLAASGNRTGPLALPNAPGVEITFNDNFGSVSGKIVSGANFAGDGGTWTVGKLIFNYSTSIGSALTVNAGDGVVMVFDSGVDGQAAEIRNTTGYYPAISGVGTLKSDLLFSGSNNMVMNMVITGSHNMIVDRPDGNLRWASNSSNFTGDFILNAGSIYIQNSSASFGSGDFIINGGAINGQTGGYQTKQHFRSKLIINANFSTNWVWFDYGGDVEISGAKQINVGSNTSTVGQRASVTFSATTNLVGTGTLTKAGGSQMEILSGYNTFSGGLRVANGILYTTVGAGGLTIGQLDAGNNYLGSGSIGITGGSVRVDTQGKATTISGSNATIAIGDAFMAFENGGAVTLGTNSVVTASNTNAHFDVSGDLVMDGGKFGDNGFDPSQNITLRFDTTTNTGDQSLVSKGASGSAIVNGLRNIDKAGSGQTTLASSLSFVISEDVRLYGGILQLMATDQITRVSGTANLLLSGGALGVAGTSQEFAELQLQGAGGSLLLGANGQITFGSVGTGTNWISTALLAIQNTSGDWNTDGTGAFMRFLTDPTFTNDQLAQISLTGYEAGVQVTNNSGFYYLTADALQTIEWTGTGGDNLWGTNSNWLGNISPDATDISVSIKDIDQNLASGTIAITGEQTLSRLNVNSAQSAVNLGGSGTLVFDHTDTYTEAARIAHTGGSVLTIGNATRLDKSIELAANAPVSTSYINWTGAVSGAGGITKTGDGTLLLYNANNAYTGGFTWQDSSVIQLGGASTTNTGGGYFGTGTLVIGNGGNTNYYIETYNNALATGSTTSAGNTTRTIGSDFILQGNLYHQFQTDMGSQVANTYNGVVSNVIFSGNGVFGDASAAGNTYIIDNVGSGGSSGVRNPYVAMRFTGDITGYANIRQMGYGTIYYLGDNSEFRGNYDWRNGHIYGAQDNFLGSGTVTISSASRHNNYLYSHNGSSYVTVSLSNPFLFSGDGMILTGTFNFDLDSSGTGAKSQLTSSSFNMGGGALVTFGKDHVIEGAGQFRFGSAGSYSFSGIARFLGANTFTGGIVTEGRIQAGVDSVWSGDTLVSGAFGVGTITVASGGYIGAYSDDPSTTSIRVGNKILLNSSDLIVVNGGDATTLILETGSIALRNGKTDLTININAPGHALSIESLLYNSANPGGFTKTGAGTLILSNTANQISGGIEAQAGAVRAVMHGANVTIGGGALTPFGTGELLTKTTTNTGTAGAFEIAADNNATVTITGTDPFTLNDNGRLRITGTDITTVLADGGRFYSSDTGQEGSLVADYILANNYALGIKLSTPLLEIDTGKTLTLLKANLLNSAGTISMTTSSTLALGTTYQSLSLLVNGDSTVDVSGGVSGNAYVLNVKDIKVNSGMLWFAGWDGNIETGLGNTIIYTDIALGRYIEGVKLGDQAATSVISLTNNNGDAVLLPFEGIFYWSGTNGGLWEEGNWNLSNHNYGYNTEPNLKDGAARFDTDYTMYNEGDIVITEVAGAERFHVINSLAFSGGTVAASGSIRISATMGGGLLFASNEATAKGYITQTGVTDVYIDAPIRLAASTGGVPKTLAIEQNGSGDLFMRGQITGALAVVEVSSSVAGSGKVVFSSTTSDFNGGFILNSGDVRVGADETAAAAPLGMGSLTFRSGTLRGTDASGLLDEERTLTNAYNLDGGVSIAGTKKLTLSGSGNIISDSVVNVTETSGTLILGAAGQTLTGGTSTLTLGGAGRVNLDASTINMGALNANGTGLVTVGGTLTGTTAVLKTNSGTLQLLGANTHSGGVAMTAGVTTIDNAAALGTGTAAFDGDATLRLDAAGLNIANAINLGAGTGTIAGTGTLSGAISGTGNVAKLGAGTLTLTNAASTNSGTTFINEGVLRATAQNALGAAELATSSTLQLAYTGSLANAVSGAGAVEVNGNVLITGGAASDGFTGTWAVTDAGTARIAESNALGANSKVALSGVLQTTGTADITLSNTLVGTGTVQFAGSGTHGFGANLGTGFTGVVDANEGVFIWSTTASAILANNTTLKTTGGRIDIAEGAQNAHTLVAAGGTLAFTGTANVTNFQIDNPTAILFDQDKLVAKSLLQQDEAEAETLVISSNAWTGNLSNLGLVTAAGVSLDATSTIALQAGAINAIYSNTLAQSGAVLALHYGLDELALQLGRTGTLSGDNGTATGSELHALVSGSGSLDIVATDMITLSSSATYTGTTFTTSGTFKTGATDAISTSALLVNNAVFDTGANAQSLRALEGSGTIHLNSALTVKSGSYAGFIDGANTLEKTTDATLILSGSNAHSGTTLVTAGILRATNAGALGSSTLSVAATGTTELSAITGTISNALLGTGALRVTDNASVNYTGNASTWSGVTSVDSGRLYVNTQLGDSASRLNVYAGGTLSGTGAITGYVHVNGGALAPGNSPGNITITGTLELAGSSSLEYDLGNITNPNHAGPGATPGVNDRTTVNGDLIAGGTTTINITSTLAPLYKGEYDLIYYSGALTGGADNFALGTFNGTLISSATDATKYLVSAGEDHYIKLLYDSGYFTYWDGGTGTNWTNSIVDGGSGTWYAPSGSMVYNAWSGSGGSPNGEWLDAGFAIFKGDSGTVTVDNSTGSGTIAFSGAQFITDGYLITGGTLTTGGTAAVELNTEFSATIATTITGTHNVQKGGGGVIMLSGSNTHTGTTTVAAGALVMTNENALGSGPAVIDANATLRVATGSMTWSNTLTGTGLLEIDLALSTDAFSFSSSAFSPSAFFAGTASFNNSAYLLDNNALAGAAVKLNTGNTTTVATGTHTLGNLTVDGGALAFSYATGTQAEGIIRTGTLDAISGTVTVSNTNPATGTTGLFASTLLQQDEGLSVRLLNATTVSGTNLTLAGGTTTTADIRDGTVTTATATYSQSLDYADGLSVDYALTQLDLVASRTTALSGDTTDTGAAELHAQITGAGNLQIDATNAITLNNAANAYTGTTFVNTGTLISGTNNALGNTAYLAVTSIAAYDLGVHTQTIANGARIAGNLAGSGSLGLGGLATITSTNAGFTANVGVTGTTVINNTQALGTTGTIDTTGQLILTSATGALAKTIAGTGTVSLAATSSVALTGTNTLSGAWDIAQDTALSASSTANLGTADILLAGMLTIGNTADETLANNLGGSGTFTKENTGNLTISQSNAFAGATQIAAGTLTLANLDGVGASTVANNATLDLAGTGTFANTISGTGVNLVSGSVSLRGANTAFTGTLRVTGTADITSNDQIGASTAKAVIASNAQLATTATSFEHDLTGSGLLAVDSVSGTFDIAATAGNAFTGTVSLANTTMHLGTSAAYTNNAWALANSTLQLLGGSTLATHSETRTLGGLDLGGGAISIPMDGTHPHEVLQTGTLTVTNASDSKIIFEGYTGTTPVISSTVHVNFLDEDGPTSTAVLLVATGTLPVGHENLHIDIVKEDGSPLASGQLVDYDNVIATYDYTGITVSKTTAFTHVGSATAGIYYDYVLTQIDVKSGTHVWLDTTGAKDNTFSAAITGTGGVVYTTGSTLIISGSNSYYGSSTITTGTLIAGVDNALGNTSRLDINTTGALDLNGHTQTIANGAQIDGNLYNSHTYAAITGSLGLGGLATITSTNAGFTANVGITGTTTINNTQALGNAGTIDTTGRLILTSATGTLAKTIAGTGTVSLAATSSVALTGTNTLSGAWDIAQDTALSASSTANLGTADILLAGLLTIGNTADETLANNLGGSGTFTKENTGNLTISQSNAFAGATQIAAGTLTLADLDGVGASTVANNATLDLAGTGTFANTISGSGVNLVSGSVSLRGINTGFTGTLNVTGTADITDNNQIGGATAKAVIATNAKLATTATSFEHDLTGAGVLAINSVSGTFDFMAATGSAFAGTVTLDATALTLDTNYNTEALASATLQLNTGGLLHANNETRRIHGLTLNGGALWLPMNGVDPVEVLNVGALSIADLGSTVVFENYTGGTTAIIDSTVQKNWLDQDNLTDNATLLVAADTLAEAAPRQIAIHKADGTALSNGQTIEHDEVLAIYNYTAQTTGSASAYTGTAGLYYDYVLTELNVKENKTLQLTDAGATDDTLSAAITGAGGVTFATGSAMTLTGTNTYTGTSTLVTGTVIAGADNALGQTKLILIEIPAAFDLNGKAQTIAEGGRIDGNITGSGTLTLVSGTLAISSANADYNAQTNIAAPAAVHATNAEALGASHVQLDGTLKVDATGTMQNTLAGSGQFHASSGDITLVNASAGFHGTGTVTAGRLTATAIDALGDAAISVAAGATFEQRDIDGTLQNALSGAGTHLVTNSTLHLDNAAAYAIASTTLDSRSALILETTGYAFGKLDMNNGALVFANLADRATIGTLGQSTGNIVMNANLAALQEGINNAATIGNHLDITNAGAGTHNVFIETNGTLPSALNASLEMIGVDAASSAKFVLANNAAGKLEYDLTVFELVRGDLSQYTPDANMWYLSDRNLSHAADAIINTASTLAIDWNYALDSVYQRLGDIRLGFEDTTTGSVWIKSRGYRLNAANELSGMSFRQYGWGVTGGADKAFATQTGVSLLGGFIDAGGINREFDNNGNGHTTNIGIGAYLTLIQTNGWFADITARADRYSNRFEARAYDGTTTKGRYTNKAIGLSFEAGRRLQRTDGWWLEPTVQVSALWLDGASYTTEANATHRAMKVQVNDSMNTQYRALLRFGRQLKDSRWAPYGKVAGVAVDSDRGAIKAHGKTFRTDYDGRRIEFGFGTSYRINSTSQLHLDYEYAKAQAYDRPWSINLGYRRLW